MAEVAKKLKALDDMVSANHELGLKTLIVTNPEKYANEDLFEIKIGQSRLGPILNQDLKAYVAQAAHFPVSCLISQFASDQWVPLLQHPYFQRRKPQLVGQQIATTSKENFFVLQHGKKQGPFNTATINRMIDRKELKVSDQISLDGGHTWGKIYEVDRFDRRAHNSSALPFMPEWQVFNKSFAEVEDDLGRQSTATDAIASLAYLENLQSGKAGNIADRRVAKAKDEHHSGPLPKNVIIVVVAIAAILATATWFASGPSEEVSTTQTQVDNKPIKAKVIPTANPAANVARDRLGQRNENQEERPDLPNRMINTIQKKNTRSPGFRQSRAFKNNVNNNNGDFTYEDDRPLEQDPIGSKLSRETVNPDDDYQQELREEAGYDAEPDYANDRFNDAKAEKDFADMYKDEDQNNVGEADQSDDPNY